LSRPEALTPRATGEGEPVFSEAWHAQALAIAAELTRAGAFTAAEWSDALGAERRASAARGEPDDDEHYYEAVLAALEGLIGRRSPSVGAALDGRTEQWRRAYLNTPHGKPVELSAGALPE
jgi:nitrile hydratase accessory protein